MSFTVKHGDSFQQPQAVHRKPITIDAQHTRNITPRATQDPTSSASKHQQNHETQTRAYTRTVEAQPVKDTAQQTIADSVVYAPRTPLTAFSNVSSHTPSQVLGSTIDTFA